MCLNVCAGCLVENDMLCVFLYGRLWLLITCVLVCVLLSCVCVRACDCLCVFFVRLCVLK